MRLSESEKQIIKQSVYVFDKQAEIVLFGSRARDEECGGDIDLLVISDNIKRRHLGQIRWQLWEKLGEQKIDLVLSEKSLSGTFARMAFKQGVVL